jgi:hypothetical protein
LIFLLLFVSRQKVRTIRAKSSLEAAGSPKALAAGQVEWRNLPKAFLQKA